MAGNLKTQASGDQASGSKSAASADSAAELETSSHIPVKPLYTPADVKGADYEHEVGYPGEYPFTRGVQATMYRGRLWTMRQYAGMGDAEESNKRYKYLLAHGTTGLSVAFDLPTQIGLDSDNPLAAGEVGKVGVAIDSLEDMERLFDGLDLNQISTSMTINATASILLALYVAVARGRGAEIQAWNPLQYRILSVFLSHSLKAASASVRSNRFMGSARLAMGRATWR